MALGEQLLKYKIVADAFQAKAEIKSTDDLFKQLGASAATSMGSFAGPAGSVVGALAGIGTAAAGAGTALFEMAKNASLAVKGIGAFSYITGISVESVGALRYAVSLAGKELTDIQRPLVFFGKLLAEAAAGGLKAQETLAKVGVNKSQFTDLEGAFATATKNINATTNEVERLGKVTSNFGTRGGPELEKVMSKMGDGFDDFKKKALELGVVLSDDDVRAARAFAHEYEKVTFQLQVAGEKFALKFAPQITNALESISEWLTHNQQSFVVWGNVVSRVFGDVISEAEKSQSWFDSHPVLWEVLKQFAGKAILGPGYMGQDFINAQRPDNPNVLGSTSVFQPKRPDTFDGYGDEAAKVREKAADKAAAAAERAAAKAKRLAEEQKRQAEQIERARVASARDFSQDETAAFEHEADKRLAIAVQYATVEKKSEADLARFSEGLEEDKLRVKSENLGKYMDQLNRAIPEEDAAWKKSEQDQRLLAIDLDTLKATHAKNEQDRVAAATAADKKLYDDKKAHWSDYVQWQIDHDAQYDAEQERAAKERAAARRGQDESGGYGTILGGIGGGANIPSIFNANDQILTQAEVIKGAYADMSQVAGQAIGGMIDGLIQLGVTWLETGQFSVKAALQMAAGVAISIAEQALMKGIMETAEAIAAAARYDFASATLHSSAAGVFYSLAAIAGGVGVGLAVASRFAGGGKKGASAGGGSAGGSSGGGSSSSSNQNLTPYSRSGPDTFISGRRPQDPATMALAVAVDKLQQKINGMSPGDVLVRGTAQRPGHVTQTVVGDLGKNASYSKQIAQRMRVGK